MNWIRKYSWAILCIPVFLMIIILMESGIITIHFGQGRTPEGSVPIAGAKDADSLENDIGGLESIESPPSSMEFSPDELENISVYDRLNSGVVNITTEVMSYNWFLEAVPRKGSSGSGSIIDSEGYVLTNNHVVENAYKVNVTLADGTTFEGEVIGSDPENDLAVVKIDIGNHSVVTIPFGTSRGLRVGQKVLAIGNPFAFERTLTTGIISGLGRPLKNDKGIVIRNLIQTDASINPGNSGGPLLTTRGELIGVNTMIYTPSGGSVGIGFAVPVDTARRVVPDLIRYGYVKRGWIDIEPVQLFPALVRYANLSTNQGILVSQVRVGGNAESAGILGGSPNKAVRSGSALIYLGGDIIIGINEQPITSLGDLYAALENTRPGDSATVRLRRGRRELEVELILSSRSENS